MLKRGWRRQHMPWRARWPSTGLAALIICAGCGLPAPESLYIPMSDGTEIAVDVWHPQDVPTDAAVPTIVRFGRYWRDYQIPTRFGTILGKYPRHVSWLNEAGYAVVMVDVRGTGASFGVSVTPWSPTEVADYPQIIDWIVAQPWSDGTVGALGVSYEGVATDWVGALNHPAVGAILPTYAYSDVYLDVSHPGGILNDRFVRAWGDITAAMDRNSPDFLDVMASADPSGLVAQFVDIITFLLRGVRPVSSGLVDLANAVSEHQQNPHVYEAANGIVFRDDLFGTVSVDKVSPLLGAETHRRRAAIRRVVGWLDAGTARGALRSFNTLDADHHVVVIAPENHTGAYYTDPYAPLPPRSIPTPTLVTNTWEAVRFFDAFLRGKGDTTPRRAVVYWTYVEDAWKRTDVWPPAGFEMLRWYLAPAGGLATEAPTTRGAVDTYAVDFEATTGLKNRWFSGLGGLEIEYPDRAVQDRRLLVYETPPLQQAFEVTGHPVITLHVSSTHAEGAFYAYLEEVTADGRVVYLTEGQLRAIHRAVSTADPPAATFGPHHTFERAGQQPLIPGEPTEITFDLLPISTVVRAGHRLRLALAGHDKDTFPRLPADGTPVWTVHRSAERPSHIDVPVRPRPEFR